MPRPCNTKMFAHLHIDDPRERALVGLADAVLRAGAAVGRLLPTRRGAPEPRRILLLRLERMGDLLMALPAIQDVRRLAPAARIDLAVGSWNRTLAELIDGIDRVLTADAPWLSRGPGAAGAAALVRTAIGWREARYDLVINFEPDIRSNLLLALSGAPGRAGFHSAGGGAVLTLALAHDPAAHTTANARRLVHAALGGSAPHASAGGIDPTTPILRLPATARAEAARLLQAAGTRPLAGVHASGGRAVKQWHTARFADVAGRLAAECGAAIVLTGSPDDRPLAAALAASLPASIPTLDLAGELSLPVLGAVLQRLAVFVTGDTGPMHLAAAVGTPVAAVFGPSDPARYAPLTSRARIVRIDLPCSPCNRIRLPPDRCRGHVPDCLDGITADAVFRAAVEIMRSGPDPSPDAGENA